MESRIFYESKLDTTKKYLLKNINILRIHINLKSFETSLQAV